MSRCQMYEESKYAYRLKQKQCKGAGVKKVVVPMSDFRKTGEFVTEIQYGIVCQGHLDILTAHKKQAVLNWQKKEADTIASLNGSAKHVENFHS